VELAIDQAICELLRRLLAAAIDEFRKTDFEAELLGDLAGGLRRCFAEAPVAGRGRVPATRECVLLERAALEDDLAAVVTHDPAMKCPMPIAINVNRRPRFANAGGMATTFKNL
jgi:hypothetical protein